MHVEHGAYAQAPGLQVRMNELEHLSLAGETTEFDDPWRPGRSWTLAASERRVWVVGDASIHVASGSVLVSNVQPGYPRAVALVAGAQVQHVEGVRLGRLRHPRVPQFGPSDIALPIAPTPNYFHWLVEVLPVVARASMAADHLGLSLTVIYGQTLNPFQRSSLDLLGVRYAETNEEFIHAHNTFLLSQPSLLNVSQADVLQLDYIRDLGLAGAKYLSTAPEKILISRSRSRRFSGDVQEIERGLEMQGWVSIRAEELSFVEQIQMFAGAKKIVGAHGAGLANMLWMNSGSRVIELAERDYWHACVPYLAATKKHEYAMTCVGDTGVQGVLDFVENHTAG